MDARLLHSITQLIALVSMTAGVFLLFGVAWALAIGGFGLLVGSTVMEATAPRPATGNGPGER